MSKPSPALWLNCQHCGEKSDGSTMRVVDDNLYCWRCVRAGDTTPRPRCVGGVHVCGASA